MSANRQEQGFDFRWGVPAIDRAREGGSDVPGFVLRNYHKLGITPTEMMLIIHLSAYHYNSEKGVARPSLKTIAAMMGFKKDASVRNHLKSLEKRGHVVVKRPKGKCSVYDFRPLSARCLSLEQGGAESPIDIVPHPDGVPHEKGRLVPHSDGDEDKELKKKNLKATADPPNGGQRRAADQPETERKRDPIFEVVIARNFGVALDDKAGVEAVRDKANWITSWLKGNAVKKNSRDKRKSLPGCSPPASPEEVGAFYDWWEREKGIDKPSTALGIAQFMSVFRQERKPARTGPAVHFPKPQHRCTVCGDQDTGEGAIGMYVGPDGASIPCPACLAAEQAAQEVRDEQAA